MSYMLDFRLKGLPPTTNGSHGHWRVAAKKRKKWRDAVKLIASLRRPPAPLLRVKITLTRFSSSQPDYDNLVISFKSVVDGLKDAGVISDDKDKVVVQRDYRWEKSSPRQGQIRIQVEELAEEPRAQEENA